MERPVEFGQKEEVILSKQQKQIAIAIIITAVIVLLVLPIIIIIVSIIKVKIITREKENREIQHTCEYIERGGRRRNGAWRGTCIKH